MAKRKLQNPNAPVTNQALGEAVDAILEGMESLPTREEMNLRFDQVDTHFDQVDNRLTNLEAEVAFVKRDISEIRSDLAVTPSNGKKHFTVA